MTGRIRILLLVAGIALIYGNTLWNGFAQDDFLYVIGNPQVEHPSFKNWFAPHETTGVFRPLTFASFALNAKLTGMKPASFHAVNVILHAGVTILLYLLLQALLGRPSIALGAAWLFAMHPIHTEAVAGIFGRAELLAAGFVFAAWLFHLRDRKFLALSCFALAMLSKESAVVFVLLVPLGDYILDRWKPLSRYAWIAGAAVVYIAIMWSASGNQFGSGKASPLDNPLAWLPFQWRILNALRIAWKYVELNVFPVTFSCDYSFNQIPVSYWSLQNIAASAGWVLVLAAAIWAILRGHRALALGIGMYVAGFAITSNIVMPIGTIFGERLAYLPSAGLCLLASLAFASVSHRKVRVSLMALMIAILAMRTVERNRDWKNNFLLYSSAVDATPNSARSHASFAEQFQKMRMPGLALAEYSVALQIYPDYVYALANGAVLEYRAENFSVAEAMMERALKIARRDDSNYDYSMVNLAALLMETGRDDRALTILNREITESPRYARAWSNRAVIRYRHGDPAGARSDAQSALRLDPGNPQAANVLKIVGTTDEHR